MSYLPQKFQTSFMDIILGTLGAFFLLLIIISTNRRGDQQEGSLLPGNILSLKIIAAPDTLNDENTTGDTKKTKLCFYKDIGFWVGLADDNGDLKAIWYSDETKKENTLSSQGKIDINNSNRNPSSEFSTVLCVGDDDRQNVVVGCWLRELPSEFSAEQKKKLLEEDNGIQIQVIWNKQNKQNNQNQQVPIGKLLSTNNFEFAVQPGIGERSDLLTKLKVPGQKPKKYASFPHVEVNNPSNETLQFLGSGAELRFSYDQSGNTLNKYGRFFLKERDSVKSSTPVYFLGRTTELQVSGNDTLNAAIIASQLIHYDLIKKTEAAGNDEFIPQKDYSKIKSIHVGIRAVALVMENESGKSGKSIKYHVIDPRILIPPRRLQTSEEVLKTEKQLLQTAYPYHSWKKIYPSPDDGNTAKWEKISQKDIDTLKAKFPDIEDDDFIYAFAEYLAEPLPDQGTDDRPLPFRRNPMLELWFNTPVPETTGQVVQ